MTSESIKSLTVYPSAITAKPLASAVGEDYVVISDSSDSGNLKKALISDIMIGGAGYVEATANYTATSNDYTINCTTGTFTVTLPTAIGITGRSFTIKNSSVGIITVEGDGTETIDGQLNQKLSQYDSMTVVSNGTNWIII